MSYHIGRGRYSRESYPQGNFGGGAQSFQIVDTIHLTPPPGGTRLVDIVTTSLEDGTIVYVRSVEDLFVLEKAVALTVDGITVVNPLVGTGQWTRRNVGSQRWLQQAAWFINATLGNDENAGTATGAGALRTHAELERRWGPSPVLYQSVTVTIETDLSGIDDASPRVDVSLDGLSILTYAGVATNVDNGVVDSAIATDAPTNTQQSITAADVGDWAPHVGRRVRLVRGALTAFSWVAQRVAATVARTGEFKGYVSTPPQAVSNFTPAAGDEWTVQTLPSARAMRFNVKRVQADVVNSNVNPLVARDLLLDYTGNPSASFGGTFLVQGSGPLASVFFACDISCGHLAVDSRPNVSLIASQVRPEVSSANLVIETTSASLTLLAAVFFGYQEIRVARGASIQTLSRSLFQGPGAGNGVILQTGAVWVDNSTGSGFFDYDTGFTVENGAYYGGFGEDEEEVYGVNVTYGLAIDTHSAFTYTTATAAPTLTGGTADAVISSTGLEFAIPEDVPIVFAWGGVYHRDTSLAGSRVQRGVATLLNGTVVVGGGGARIFIDGAVPPRIILTRNTFVGTVAGTLEAPSASRVSGGPGVAAFTINSRNAAGALADDDSTVDWAILS